MPATTPWLSPLGNPGPVLRAACVCPQSSMRELVESGRYDTREDFSVVLQPFFRDIRLPLLAVRPLPSPVRKKKFKAEMPRAFMSL